MTLLTNYADDTVSATNHALAHNDVNTQVNALIARYQRLQVSNARATSGNITGSGVYPMQPGQNFSVATGAGTFLVFGLDPADFAVTGLSTKLRFVVSGLVNDTAPAMNFVFGLYPVGTPSGGLNIINPNFGTVVSGSTVTFTAPGANTSPGPTSSGDFDFPTAGRYGIAVNCSAAMTANSAVNFAVRLEVHNV